MSISSTYIIYRKSLLLALNNPRKAFSRVLYAVSLLAVTSFLYFTSKSSEFSIVSQKVEAQQAAQCLVYTIAEGSSVTSVIVALDLYGVQTPQVLTLDDDVEALDIHPIHNTVWAAGEINGDPAVGIVDLANGTTSNVLSLGGGVDAIEALAFRPVTSPTDVPELWAWTQKQELIIIDMQTGATTLWAQYNSEVEGLAWSNDGQFIYGAGKSDLYRIDATTKQIERIDSGFGASSIEGLDMRPDGLLMISNQGGGDLIVFAYNLETMEIQQELTHRASMEPFPDVDSGNLDIESISWPDDCEIPTIGSGWVMTVGGDTFSEEFVQPQPETINADLISSAIGQQVDPFLSTYSFIQSSANQLPTNNSANNFSLNSYTDSNTLSQAGVTWYEFLSSQLGLSSIPIPIGLDQAAINNTVGENISGLSPNLISNQIRIYQSTDSVNLSKFHICDSKAIFIIDGDLTIDPDFVNSGFDNGCMFLVSGKVIVGTGQNKGTNDTDLFYDRLEGFFVASEFTTVLDGDGLFIKGGIVADQINFGRNIGEHNNYAPSEIVAYDPRYMHLFQDLLTYQYPNNILEKQFIRSLE